MRDTSVFHYSRTKHPCSPPSFSLSTSYLLCPWGTALALGPGADSAALTLISINKLRCPNMFIYPLFNWMLNQSSACSCHQPVPVHPFWLPTGWQRSSEPHICLLSNVTEMGFAVFLPLTFFFLFLSFSIFHLCKNTEYSLRYILAHRVGSKSIYFYLNLEKNYTFSVMKYFKQINIGMSNE